MLFQPHIEIKKVVLLAPEHAGKSLPHYQRLILAQGWRYDAPIELVGFAAPCVKYSSESPSKRITRLVGMYVRQSQPDHRRCARIDAHNVVRSRLRAFSGRVHSI